MPQHDGKQSAHKGVKFEECPSLDTLLMIRKNTEPSYLQDNPTGCLAITLNPPDGSQFWNEVNRIQKFTEYHTGKLCKLAIHAKTVRLYGEVSPTGRLHMHGYINFETYKKKLNFYIDYLHYLQDNYMYEIDTIKDMSIWQAYCAKQMLFEIQEKDLIKISKAVQLATKTNPYMNILECQ